MNEIRALLFDAGNTRLKWGYFTNGRISKAGSVRHEQLQDKGFAVLTTRLPRTVTHAAASNVAGNAFAARLSSVVGLHCDIDVHFARCEKSAFGVTNAYRRPRRLGVDRWTAMIGARCEFQSALCIVDVGTAITIDVLDRAGQHLGGQIMPGLQMMDESLRRSTSGIMPATRRIRDPQTALGIFGNSTDQAVAFGCLTAVCGAIERTAKHLGAARLRPKIVLTGGDASRILKQLNNNAIHRPNLVLQGLVTMLKSDK